MVYSNSLLDLNVQAGLVNNVSSAEFLMKLLLLIMAALPEWQYCTQCMEYNIV